MAHTIKTQKRIKKLWLTQSNVILTPNHVQVFINAQNVITPKFALARHITTTQHTANIQLVLKEKRRERELFRVLSRDLYDGRCFIPQLDHSQITIVLTLGKRMRRLLIQSVRLVS